MKIKVTELDYDKVLEIPGQKHKKPVKTLLPLKLLIYALSKGDLKKVNFKVNRIGMDRLDAKAPCLVLMNHSCFLDLEIAANLLYPRNFNIVCTSDGFVGKEGLMRAIGCIPTQKFVTDPVLVKDMKYTLDTLKCSILMYPEASYSFDGTATPLPESIGKCIKLLKAPVVMIKTYGAFARDPLYNNLQVRKVDVSADYEYLLSPEDIEKMSADEIAEVVNSRFTFDNFRWQQENEVRVTESFRADGLNRVLYKCPACGCEDRMEGKGIHLTCNSCGKKYELDELGYMKATEGETEYDHVPDWYRWERECVKDELLSGTYKLDVDVDIAMMVDKKSIYKVGSGRLIHDNTGFTLTGCDGRLNYKQKPSSSYSLYSDYFWYEIGDMICIGDSKTLYYCFPKNSGDVVAKTRIAAEELYKLKKAERAQRLAKQ